MKREIFILSPTHSHKIPRNKTKIDKILNVKHCFDFEPSRRWPKNEAKHNVDFFISFSLKKRKIEYH